MGIMRPIGGVRAGKAVSVSSGNQEHLFFTGRPGPVRSDGFWETSVRCGPEAVSSRTGSGNGPFLFFGSRTNRFLDFTGGLLKALFPISSEHVYDMTVFKQEVDLGMNRYITHSLVCEVQKGTAKYGREKFGKGRIWEQAYICYMIRVQGRLCVLARAFDTEQFCYMDGHRSRAGEGPLVEAHAHLIVFHLSGQFPSGEVARSFLEDICRKDTGHQRNYDVICREYTKDNFMEQELEHLIREAVDNMR